MDVTRYVLAALCASLLVWYVNFSSLGGAGAAGRSALWSDAGGGAAMMMADLGDGKLHVLVTGGAGYIGSHAALRLLELGHAVTVVDNLSRGNLGAVAKLREAGGGRLRFAQVDLGDKAELMALLTASPRNIDAVIHFAAVAYVAESTHNPLKYYHNITSNTVTLLECMHRAGIRQLVYSSTCAVYGNTKQLPVTEATPPTPNNPYGTAKLAAEHAIRHYAASQPDFRSTILRYFNVYGSDPAGRLGESPHADLRQYSRISGACMDAALGRAPQLGITGTHHPTPDGTCIRDYIHVSDLVEAHIVALGQLSNPPRLYNVGTGRGVSVREFVNACLRVTGRNLTIVEQAEARPGDYPEMWADVSKIRDELGWRAQYTDVEVGLGHAWRWHSTHPGGYGSRR